MSEVKVPGGKVYTRTSPHSCAKPEPRKFDIGDVFECAGCGDRFELVDLQQYQGGPYWRALPTKGVTR